jgi:hypothetical protein
MGAGKSTIGQEVADLSGRPFVDLDREIERRHGSVAELFERGEAEFRRIEEELAAEVLASSTPAVIALGGGAVLSERTRELRAPAAGRARATRPSSGVSSKTGSQFMTRCRLRWSTALKLSSSGRSRSASSGDS